MLQVAGGILLALLIISLLPLIIAEAGFILKVILILGLFIGLTAIHPGLGLLFILIMAAIETWKDVR